MTGPTLARFIARWKSRAARRHERRLTVLWPSVAFGLALLLLAYENVQHRDTRVELAEAKAELKRLKLPNGRDQWACLPLRKPGVWGCVDTTRKM